MTLTTLDAMKTVTLAAFNARKSVCGGCENAASTPEGQACSLCECSTLAKMTSFNEVCPAGKWPSLTEQDCAGVTVDHLRGA